MSSTMPNTGVATFLNMLRPLWVRAAPAGPSSTAHCPCRAACRCSSLQSTSLSICCSAPMTIVARQIAASRWARENPSTCSAARNFPLGLSPSCRPNVGRPERRTLSGPAMWRDASRIRRSVTEAISFSYPHGTTSGWLLAALGPEHGLRQHLVCLSRSATRWNSSRDLWRLSRKHPERRDRLR